MKFFLSVVLVLSGWTLAVGETGFWNQLTAEERAAAGLAQLTIEQQAMLDKLAARFAREGARQAVAEARAETKAEIETAIRERAIASAGRGSSDVETVRSRISGKFRGWRGQTVFKLENGQTWMQADKSEVYWLPAQEGPEVEIRKAGISGWKLFLPQGRWVRVKRVD